VRSVLEAVVRRLDSGPNEERPAGWASEALVWAEGGGLIWGVRGWPFREERANPPPLLNRESHY